MIGLDRVFEATEMRSLAPLAGRGRKRAPMVGPSNGRFNLKPSSSRCSISPSIEILRRRTQEQTQGDRDGQRSAKRQSRNQETQKREGQGDCRGAEPEDRWMAAVFRARQKEIENN